MGQACCSDPEIPVKAPVVTQATSAKVAAERKEGTVIYLDGSKYLGQLLNGKRHGQGRLECATGEQLEGIFVHDLAEGPGVYVGQLDGLENKYVGQFKKNMKHGKAVETWSDGSCYVGQYADGRKNGEGSFDWPDGSRYEGAFRDGDVHGQGSFSWPDGRKYVGEWEMSRMQGRGVYIWPDGRKYEGTYSQDLKHGEGTFRWADGRTYRGQWEKGKMHGLGVLSSVDGSEWSGQWVDGRRKAADKDPTASHASESRGSAEKALARGE